MTPAELAGFASTVGPFSDGQIDLLYHLARWLDAGSVPTEPTEIGEGWRLVTGGEEEANVGDDVCLRFIAEVAAVDPDVPLAVKFFELLEAAGINLTISPSPTPPPVSPLLPPTTPEDDTIESVDPNSPRWQLAVAIDRRKLITQVLDVWTERVEERRAAYLDYEDPVQNAIADRVRRDRLARISIAQWRGAIAKIRWMEQRADEFRRRKDAEKALKTLTLAARAELFIRIRQERAALKALNIWREKTARIREMEQQADNFRNQNAARNVLGIMARTTAQHQLDEAQADSVAERSLARRVSNQWFTQTQQRQLDDERADAAADYYAGKHVLKKFKAKAQEIMVRKEEEQAREHMLAWKYVRKWRAATHESKEAKYNEAYKIMRRKIKENTARAALQKWRDKLREIREMERVADEFRARKDEENAQKKAHSAIVHMYNKTEEMKEAEKVADNFYNKNLVRRRGLFGSAWLNPTRGILDNQKIADEYRATRLASYAAKKLREWKNMAFRVKRLEADADALLFDREQKRVFAVLMRWKGKAVESGADAAENTSVPATPAARRSQLLASTTPAYTPAVGLFEAGGRVEEEEVEEE